jgi:hypothetical protein
MYQPPRFGLLHFADSELPWRAGGAVRWLSGWQGPAGQPAEQVTLGWAYDETMHIVVATSTVQRLPHKADRRADGVIQALEGLRLPVPAPLSAAEVQQTLDRARTVRDHNPVELIGDGQVCTGAVRTVHGALVGHARVGVRVATFAAVGLAVEDIRLQTLESRDGYEIDPRTRASIDDVKAHWPPFLTRP